MGHVRLALPERSCQKGSKRSGTNNHSKNRTIHLDSRTIMPVLVTGIRMYSATTLLNLDLLIARFRSGTGLMMLFFCECLVPHSSQR